MATSARQMELQMARSLETVEEAPEVNWEIQRLPPQGRAVLPR
jgi:hypothetical protein